METAPFSGFYNNIIRWIDRFVQLFSPELDWPEGACQPEKYFISKLWITHKKRTKIVLFMHLSGIILYNGIFLF